MLKEALQLLVDLSQKSETAQRVPLPGHRIALVRGNDIELYDEDRKARTVTVDSLASFNRWVAAIGDGRDVQITVSSSCITAIVDCEEHINDTCHAPLPLSAAWESLAHWSGGPLPVAEVVKLLRTTLDGTFNKQHLPTFRSVDFQRMKAAAMKVSHTGESMGRTVEKLAQSSAGEIPEILTFELEVYALDVAFTRRKVQFAVDVNCDSERIAITPVGDCITEAIKATKAELIEWLDTKLEGCLILAGSL